MTSQPDNQFRNGLERDHKSPPPYTWSRIEAGLVRRKIIRTQLKAAAALVLLLATSFMLWRSTDKIHTSPSLATEKSTPQIPTEDTITSSKPVIPEISTTEVETSEPTITSAKHSRRPVKEIQLRPAEIDPTQEITTSWPDKTSVPDERLPEESTIRESAETTPVAQHESTPLKSTAILYSADETNTRFLKKNNLIAVADPPKSTSGFNKVLNIASDIKNNEFSYGDLRQAKNNLLSFSFNEQSKIK